MKTKSIIDFVGNTPLVEVQNILQKKGVNLLLKLEGNNPGGSVKDRAAYNMISEAIKRKNIRKGDTLVEATSGNTGIALALMAHSYLYLRFLEVFFASFGNHPRRF